VLFGSLGGLQGRHSGRFWGLGVGGCCLCIAATTHCDECGQAALMRRVVGIQAYFGGISTHPEILARETRIFSLCPTLSQTRQQGTRHYTFPQLPQHTQEADWLSLPPCCHKNHNQLGLEKPPPRPLPQPPIQTT
jgi:hypothetical protein